MKQYKAIYHYKCDCPNCGLVHTMDSGEYDNEDSLYNAIEYDRSLSPRNIVDYTIVSRSVEYGEWG